MGSLNLKLHGEFKVNVFNGKGELKSSSDYIKNFITNSGAALPYYFAFADCFRYLSLGTGNTPNSTGVLGLPPTTGLSSGVNAFSYLGSGNYVTGGFLGGGCGNFADPNSNTISLIREWGIPDNTGGIIQTGFNFTEIMVSAGRPYVTGWSSNGGLAYPTGACLCSEGGVFSVNDGSLSNPDTFGLECSQVAAFYDILQQVNEEVNSQSMTNAGLRSRIRMCDAPFAFSRITGNFPVASGDIMTVTYKLNLTFGTGVQSGLFTSSTHDTNGNWAALGYVANITNPGIKLIVDSNISQANPTIAAPAGNRLQHIDYSQGGRWPLIYLYGESFVPSMGIPFEPSCVYGTNGNFTAYISDDDVQFFVSPTGGACNTGLFKPWNAAGSSLPQNSGLLKFQTIISGNLSSLAIYDGSEPNYWSTNPYNIRQSSSSVQYPSTGDVTTPTSSSPNVYKSPNQSNSLYYPNSRGGAIATSYQFQNYFISNLGSVQSTKSYILAFTDTSTIGVVSGNASSAGDYASLMPFFDCLFSGISGSNHFLPTIQNGTANNSIPTEIINAAYTGYNYLSGDAGYYYPILNTQLTWMADCPHGVSGCP